MLQTLIYLFLEELSFWFSFWYGLWPKSFARKFFDFLGDLDHQLGLRAHLRNFFVPLYGQKDLISLLISIVYRAFLLLFGALISFVVGFVWLALLFLWLFLPIYLLIVLFTNNGLLF